MGIEVKRAKQMLRQHGGAFVRAFAAACPGAIVLDRKDEPTAVWVAADQVNFVCVAEFSGPYSVRGDAPLVFKIRTNLYPDPALWELLRSTVLRSKLGLGAPKGDDSGVATDPALELRGIPEEIAILGGWVCSRA